MHLYCNINFIHLIPNAASLVVFGILSLEEFKPMWGASTVYDSMDILASFTGSLLAIFTFEITIIFKKKRKRDVNHEL